MVILAIIVISVMPAVIEFLRVKYSKPAGQSAPSKGQV
jgi:hypothetical protein